MTGVGLAVIVGYLFHAATHLRRSHPEELIWACHLGALAVAAGLIGRWPLPVAVGVEWLVVGNLFWLVGLGLGGEFLPTTLLTHLGGLVAGLYGLRAIGVVAGAWHIAAVALVALWAVTWFVTPARTQVNLAHGIQPGFEQLVPWYSVYIVVIFVACLGLFAGTETALLRAGFHAVS